MPTLAPWEEPGLINRRPPTEPRPPQSPLDVAALALGMRPAHRFATGPTVFEAAILQSLETMWVRPLKTDGTSALGAIQAMAEGVSSFTVNGGPPIFLSGAIRAVGMEGVVIPLGPEIIRLRVDDNDAGWSSTQAWTNKVGGTGAGNFFTSSSAVNNQFHVSSADDATATWAFDDIPPGRYRISANLWDLVGPDRATDAVYTVRDGVGTVLGTFPFDLSQILWPDYDRMLFSLELHDLGEVVLGGSVPDTISVTLSRATSSGGVLVADTLVLASVYVPPAVPGDTVVATFPAGAFTIAGAASDAATIPVPFWTDRDFCEPIPPPEERTLKCGYNIDSVRMTWFNAHFSDRSRACDAWTGDVTLDEHYEMVANTGTARRTLTYYPSGDGLTMRGMFTMPEGPIRCEFDVSGVTFDEDAQSHVSLATFNSGNAPMPPNPVIGSPAFTLIGGGRWRMVQSVTRPAWEPIATRTMAFSPWWDQGVQFVIDDCPGLVIKDFRWFDPGVPIGEPGVAHPDEKARLKPGRLVYRSMNALATNFSKARNPGDFVTEADILYPQASATTPSGNAEFVIWQANLLSVRPADVDPGTDTDDVCKHFPVSGYDVFYVATFDRDVSDYPAGNNFTIRDATPVELTATAGAGTCNMPVMWGAFPIAGKPTELVISSASTTTYSTTSNERATLAGVQTYTGATGTVFKNSLMPLETFLKFVKDLDGEPWICVPHLATDALIDWMADQVIAYIDDGVPVHVEYSNETWNASWLQFHYFYFACQYANYLHSIDATTYPFTYASPVCWIAHQMGRCFNRFRARFVAAGRDPNLVIRHFAALTQNYSITEQMMSQCAIEGTTNIDFDYISLDAYQDKDPPGFELLATDLAASGRRLSPEGKLDVLAASTFHGIRFMWIEGHLSRVAAVAGYEGKLASAYEGGWSYIATYDGTARVKFDTYEMMSSPRMFFLTASKQALYQRIGIRVHCKYVYEYYSIPGNTVAWSDAFCNCFRLGTGHVSENIKPYLWPDSYGETVGGRLAFASGHDFDAVPPPTGWLRLRTAAGGLVIGVG